MSVGFIYDTCLSVCLCLGALSTVSKGGWVGLEVWKTDGLEGWFSVLYFITSNFFYIFPRVQFLGRGEGGVSGVEG